MKDAPVVQEERAMTATEVLLAPISVTAAKNHVIAVRQIMSGVMEKDKHYGVIPGTDKPSLYQPGAQLLCMAFHIGARYEVEAFERNSPDEPMRFQVRTELFHQPTGTVLGTGVGSANSHEEKYRWMRATPKQYEAAPANKRRIKYVAKWGRRGSPDEGKIVGEYENQQVERDPNDLENTLMKMAAKRSHTAAVLGVLAASDVFNQDLEDLTEELREVAVEHPIERTEPQQRQQGAQQQARPEARPAAAKKPSVGSAESGNNSGGANPGTAAPKEVKKEDLPEGVEYHEGMAKAAGLEALADIMNGLTPDDQKKYRPFFSYMRSHFTAQAA